jgi:agmatinase
MSDHPNPSDPHNFDPDAPADAEGGLYGLPSRPDALINVIPVPYEATTSYRRGTREAPAAIVEASMQVDLEDARFGPVWKAGIDLLDPPTGIDELADEAADLASPIIARGGASKGDEADIARIDAIGEEVTRLVREAVAQVIADGAIPAMLGGEHSLTLGPIEAVAEAYPGLGVLQIDAHLDLRKAFEGFKHSHASVMYNALQRVEGLERIVAVGIRDHGKSELDIAKSDPRVLMFTDEALADDLARGRPYIEWCDEVIAALPSKVYITLDIDGMDPSLCPSTGTPVPGGFSWQQLSVLLGRLAESGKRVVGFDLVEVGNGQEIDAIVGARALYRLCGVAAKLHTR